MSLASTLSEDIQDLTYRCNAAAWHVHRSLGPGLPEDLYRESLTIELRDRGIAAEEGVKLPATYKGRRLRRLYEVDILVESRLVIETKTVNTIAAIHVAQTLSYLRMTNSSDCSTRIISPAPRPSFSFRPLRPLQK